MLIMVSLMIPNQTRVVGPWPWVSGQSRQASTASWCKLLAVEAEGRVRSR
jgi:hypothetical protein